MCLVCTLHLGAHTQWLQLQLRIQPRPQLWLQHLPPGRTRTCLSARRRALQASLWQRSRSRNGVACRQPGRGAAGLAGSRYISNCSSKRAGELVVAPSGTPYLMPHTLCPCTPLPVPCRMPLRCFLCFSSQRNQIAHMTHRIFIRIALRPSAQEFFPVQVFLSLCSFHSSSSCSPSTSCCWPYDERSGVISIDCHAE